MSSLFCCRLSPLLLQVCPQRQIPPSWMHLKAKTDHVTDDCLGHFLKNLSVPPWKYWLIMLKTISLVPFFVFLVMFWFIFQTSFHSAEKNCSYGDAVVFLQGWWVWIDGSWFSHNSWNSESRDNTSLCLMLSPSGRKAHTRGSGDLNNTQQVSQTSSVSWPVACSQSEREHNNGSEDILARFIF